MNKSNPTLVGWSFLILVALIIAAGLSTPAYCQTKDVALLLQQSPARGGVVIPNEGVHHFESQSKVTLNAIPKPGYQFLHWLGDVSDPSSSRTVVCTDKPKIVIAVYEQVEHNSLKVISSAGGGGSGGGLFVSATDYSGSSSLSYGGGSNNSKPKYRELKYPQIDGSESTPEVPEPATVVLLGLGTIFALAGRGNRRRNHSNL
jgi:hypothetical protein